METSFKYDFEMNSYFMWGFWCGINPFMSWGAFRKAWSYDLQTTYRSSWTYCVLFKPLLPWRPLVLEAICVCQLWGTGNRLHHRDNDSRDRLLTHCVRPSCVYCIVHVSCPHVSTVSLIESQNQNVTRKPGSLNWSQEILLFFSHTQPSFLPFTFCHI